MKKQKNMPLANDVIRSLQTQLRSSGALNPGKSPTPKDIELSQKLRSAQASREADYATQKREEVYGKQPPGADNITVEKKPGPLERVLKALAVPVNVVAGAAETALGKGTKSGLLENIASNIDEGGTFGDILRSSGAPQIVAMPVGLAFDIALDPLNWVSAGQAAIIPRMFKGLTKGGVSGLKVAAKSGALQKAEGLLKVPGAKTAVDYAEEITKRFRPTLAGKAFSNAVDLPPTWSQRLAETTGIASREASDAFDRVVGGGIDELTRRGSDQQTFVEKEIIGRVRNAAGKKWGEGKMEAIKSLFKYDDKGFWEKNVKKAEEATAALKSDYFDPSSLPPWSRRRLYEEGKILDRLEISTQSGFDLAEGTVPSRAVDPSDFSVKSAAMNLDEELNVNLIKTQLEEFSKHLRTNPEAMKRLGLMSSDDKDQIFALFKNFGVTDVPEGTSKFIDRYNDGIANLLTKNKTVNDWLENYERAITVFKSMAIGWSIPAHVNAFISNIPFTGLAGINPFTDDFIRKGKDVVGALQKGNHIRLLEVLGKDVWGAAVEDYPEIVQKVLGINPSWIKYGPAYLDQTFDDIVKQARDLGFKGSVDDLSKELDKYKGDILELMGKEAGEARIRQLRKSLGRSSSEALKTFSVLKATSEDDRIAIGQEVMIGVSKRWLQILKKDEAAGSKLAGAIRFIISEPMDQYGKIDQAWKLTTASHLTQNGISEAEYRTLNRWMKFGENEVIKDAIGTYYKLTPLAALRVANETYLNYSALPAFAKVMRSLPIIGAPFFSFTYASGARLLRAAHLNPGFYNKISFFLHELSGEKDPLEKKALTGKYYSYLNRPEFVKLPFFQKNPIYLNMQQMLPHLSFQLLQTGERDYESEYGSEIANWIDRSSLLQTPEGQLLLNYVILPMILGEAVNRVGQPIYPEDATAPEIAGRVLTGAADPFVPRSPSALAAFLAAGIPEEAIPYLPGYAFRKMRYALQGRTSSGVPAKEHPASRTIRSILSEIGVPVHRMDISQQ